MRRRPELAVEPGGAAGDLVCESETCGGWAPAQPCHSRFSSTCEGLGNHGRQPPRDLWGTIPGCTLMAVSLT
jgi:hypothetical protein